MTTKPTHEELEQRVKELEKESVESKRIEKSLRDSEERYRLLLEKSHDIPYSVTPDGIITFVGPQIDRFGHTPKDVISRHYLEFVVPEQRQFVMDAFEVGTKSQTAYSTEFQWQGKDGNRHWVEAVGEIICDNSGYPISQIGALRDISERKQAEKALRESEEKYRNLFEFAGDALFIMSFSEEQGPRFVDCNDSTLKLFGCTLHDQIIGKQPGDFSPPTQPDGKPSNEKARELANSVMEGHPQIFEWAHHRLDGTPFWVEVNLSPIEIKGEFLIEAVVREITDRVQAEERLLQESAMRDILLDNLPCVALVLRKYTREIVSSNKAAKQMGAVPGKTCYETCAERDDNCPFCLAPKLWATGESQRVEVEYRGTYYECIWVPLTEELYVHYIFDITERKKAEKALRESEEKYRALFEDSPISLWEEDLSAVKSFIGSLRDKGVNNFRTYFEEHPEDLAHCVAMVKIVDINKTTMDMYQVETKEEFLKGLSQFFTEDSYEMFREEIISLCEGKTSFEGEAVTQTATGEVKHIYMKCSLALGCEETWSKMLVSIVDVTERIRAEQALQESEEKYRTYIEHANDGISVVHKRKLIFVNSRLAEIMGFKVDELEGKDFLQFFPKDKVNQITDNLKRRLAGEEVPQVYESRILHKDSREIDVEFNVTTIEFNDEPATLTITRDITERKQAEEALQSREKLINALLNNQVDAATVVDKELKMLYVNEFLADRFGRSVDEMIGLSPEDVGDKADIVTAKRVAYFKQVATTGKPVRFEDKREGIWFDTVVTPVLDKDGQVFQVAILARDITDKKKSEQALVESEEKYRGLVETMADGLAIQDKNGLIIYVNNRFCKTVGYQQDEVIGKPIIDLLDERNEQIVKGEIARRRKGAPAQSYETEITRKDGRQIPVVLSPRDILDSDGQFKGSFAVFTDISSRKQAEEALQNAHRELEQKVEERTAELKKTTEQLNALMNATTDTVLLIDQKGYVVVANAVTAERFGMSLDQLLGTCTYDFMSPKLAKSRKAMANRVAKTGKPHRFEDEQKGTIFDSTVYPVLDDGGKVVQLAIYGKDITERKRSERALKRSEDNLRIKTKSLEEMNTALKILLNSKAEDQREFEERILANVKHLVLPYLEKMRKHLTDENLKAYLHILETNLNNIISPFSQKLSSKYMYLTTTEIEVANLVKEGRNSKDIAEMLGTSYKTIQNHRVNIRKKLGITNKPVNLRTYLTSLQ